MSSLGSEQARIASVALVQNASLANGLQHAVNHILCEIEFRPLDNFFILSENVGADAKLMDPHIAALGRPIKTWPPTGTEPHPQI